MPLDPQAKAMLEIMNSIEMPPLDSVEPAVLREMMTMPAPEQLEPVAAVVDRSISGAGRDIPVRIYTPEGRGPFPGIAFYHGGGFVLGTLDTYEAFCRHIANQVGAVVVSVDYGLAPEHKFPQAPDECYVALEWLSENAAELGVDAARLAVMGDSAGGCLAAVVSQMAAERNGPAIAHQMLIYPVTHCHFDTVSYLENAEGYFLTREMMQWFWGHYLVDDSQAEDPKASPLCQSSLAGLPNATVITAGYDPLRDEGAAYKDRLLEGGVETGYRNYDGMFHGFVTFSGEMDVAAQAVEYICEQLRRDLVN